MTTERVKKVRDLRKGDLVGGRFRLLEDPVPIGEHPDAVPGVAEQEPEALAAYVRWTANDGTSLYVFQVPDRDVTVGDSDEPS